MATIAEERRIRMAAEEIGRRAAEEFQSDVVRVKVHFEEDWNGADAIYVFVVLEDRAARPTKKRDAATEIRQYVRNAFQESEIGIIPYVRFRTETEYREMKDPLWD